MNLVERAQNILMKPKEEWGKIKAESTTIAQLFFGYAVFLAAIPPIAQFIGWGLIGRRIPLLGWIRVPIGQALVGAIVTYVLSLISVYVLGIIINALAPSFGSKQNLVNAMKLAVFSFTAPWIAGVFNILPVISILTILGLYGLYILYLGFSEGMMDTPKDKVIGYYVVSLVVAVILFFVVSLIVGAIVVWGGGYRAF
jgi:hypothetical protein